MVMFLGMIAAMGFLGHDYLEKHVAATSYGRTIAERQGISAGDAGPVGQALKKLEGARDGGWKKNPIGIYKASHTVMGYATQQTGLDVDDLTRLYITEQRQQKTAQETAQLAKGLETVYGAPEPTVAEAQLPVTATTFGAGGGGATSTTSTATPAATEGGQLGIMALGVAAAWWWLKRSKA